MIAIVSFILEDFILHTVLNVLPGNNYYLSLVVKMVIIFSLNPINKAIEGYLLKKVTRNKKQRKAAANIPTNELLPEEQGLLSYT